MGRLGWTEDQFWGATLRGFYAAVRGYNERTTGKVQATEDETESLIAGWENAPETVESLDGEDADTKSYRADVEPEPE